MVMPMMVRAIGIVKIVKIIGMVRVPFRAQIQGLVLFHKNAIC